MPRCFALALFLWLIPLVWAQTPSPESAEQVFERARKVYGEEGAKPALPLFEQALELYRKAGDRRGEAIVTGLIGNCHKRLGDYSRALELLNRALAMKQELGDRPEEGRTLNNLGLLFYDMGRYPEGIAATTRAISMARELKDRRLEGAALNNLSLIYDEMGNYKKSLEGYRAALALHREASYGPGESDALGNLGGTHLLLGQFKEAMHFYRQAQAISERLNLKSSLSKDLGNLGHCLLGLGQVEEAIASYDRALTLAREAGEKQIEADWLKGKGAALVQMGKYEAALQLFDQSVQAYGQSGAQREMAEASHERGNLYVLLGDATSAAREFARAIEISRKINHPRGVTFSLIALGSLEVRRKRFEEAGALYRDALGRAQEVGDLLHRASVLINLANVYRLQGRLDESREQARKGLETATSIESRLLQAEAHFALAETARDARQPDSAIKGYAAATELLHPLGEPELAWRVAFGRGRAFESLGQAEEALAAYQAATVTIESVRGQLSDERFRSAYLEDKYQVYVALIQILLKLGRPDEAFRYSEKLRARSYLELITRKQLPLRNETQRQAETALRERLRTLQNQVTQENRKSPSEQRRGLLETFSEELAAAERDYQNLLDELFNGEPGYAEVRALAVPSSSEVQRALPPGVALAEYVVSEDGIAIFLINSRELRATTVPIRWADLRSRVELLRDLVSRESRNDWRLPAENLRRLLIEPLEKEGWLAGVKRLYIVPHGILHYVPFAVLARKENGGHQLLLEQFEIAYLPAAATLTHRRANDTATGSLLALAPQRSQLKFAQQEVAALGQVFPKERLLLTGLRATESAFKEKSGEYRFLHLATHGYFNKMNPLLSGLELEADARNDGRLEVHEILALRLRAELVTLSACETALGSGYFSEIPSGDDLVGLTRAVLFAGSPSVLATLWEVNDRSTLSLMRDFYGRLKNGGKALSLAHAQREMRRRGGRYAHPFFWAPFVMVGEM